MLLPMVIGLASCDYHDRMVEVGDLPTKTTMFIVDYFPGCEIVAIDKDRELGGNAMYNGSINDVQQTGSNDIYIIEYNNKPLCIPALVDVIEEVNIKEGYMKIKLPKGLID